MSRSDPFGCFLLFSALIYVQKASIGVAPIHPRLYAMFVSAYRLIMVDCDRKTMTTTVLRYAHMGGCE